MNRHALLTSGQDLRRKEIQHSFSPPCSKDLINIITEYEEPNHLKPLGLNKFGEGSWDRADSQIKQAILGPFYLDDPSSRLLQQNIINCHSRSVLDPLFFRLLSLSWHLRTTAAYDAGNVLAWDHRESEFHAFINYLSFAKCERLLKEKLQQINEKRKILTKFSPQENWQGLNSDYHNLARFFNTMTRHTTGREVTWEQLDQIGLDMDLLNAQTAITQQDFVRARYSLRFVFERACKLRDKQKIIDAAIQWIQLEARQTIDSFEEILCFSQLLKKLCLTYPEDLISYSSLLFAVDDLMKHQCKFSGLRQLYRDAKRVLHNGLPPGYHAKYIYRYAMSRCNESTDPKRHLDVVVASLFCLNNIYQKYARSGSDQLRWGDCELSKEELAWRFAANPPERRDLSRSEFLSYFSSLFQLAATTISTKLIHFLPMGDEQLKSITDLWELTDEFTSTHQSGSPSGLKSPLTPCELRSTQVDIADLEVLSLAANCYKIALTVLLKISIKERQRPIMTGFNGLYPAQGLAADGSKEYPTLLYWDAFFSVFDGLVHFYLEYNFVDELTEILADSSAIHFPDIPMFPKMLVAWRKLLNAKLKAIAKSTAPRTK